MIHLKHYIKLSFIVVYPLIAFICFLNLLYQRATVNHHTCFTEFLLMLEHEYQQECEWRQHLHLLPLQILLCWGPVVLLIIMLNAWLVSYINVSPELQLLSRQITSYKYSLVKFTGMLLSSYLNVVTWFTEVSLHLIMVIFFQWGTYNVWKGYEEFLCRSKASKCLSTDMKYQLSLGILRT